MGMDINFFKEENITKNLELYSDLDNKKEQFYSHPKKRRKKSRKIH